MDLEARYQKIDKIGAGSYATVYRARDNELGREVAIKEIHAQFLSDPEQLDRYWQEAQLLASLHHPNIVTIFDLYRDRGWLILELMQSNLAERMAGRPMDLRALRTTLAHALRALKYLHSRGVVHGDIKPSNLMIDARKRVKIGDFGLARRVSDEDGSMLKGTTKYMAPETVSDEFGDVGPASDLYSLGFAAYELMCGEHFEELFPGLSAFGRNKQVAWMMWHAAPDRRLPEIGKTLEGVPPDIAKVVQGLCEKDQSKRYKSADEALSDLQIDVKMVKTGDEGDGESTSAAPPATDKKRLLIAGGALAMSLLMSLMLLLGGGENPSNLGQQNDFNFGVVREVLPGDNKVVVEDVESGKPRELDLGSNPSIFLKHGEMEGYVLLRELQPDDRVEIKQESSDPGRETYSLVGSRPVTDSGKIRKIDLADNRVLLAMETGERRGNLDLRVPSRARLTVNGDRRQLRDIKPDDQVTVAHLPELGSKPGRVLLSLVARRPKTEIGYIEKYDPESRKLTVKYGLGSSGNSFTLPLAEDVRISLAAGGRLTPDDLRPDDRVQIRYDIEFLEIQVTRGQQQLAGTVKSVSPQSREVTVQTDDGKLLTFLTNSETAVTLSIDPAPIDALREFDNVSVTYAETSDGKYLASSLDAARPDRNDRWAVVLGIESYRDKNLTPLEAPLRNAALVREVLMKRYAFKDERVLALSNENRDTIQQQAPPLLEGAGSQTQVIVYLSCHAYVGPDDVVYLAASDFNLDNSADTGLPLDWVVQQLEECRASEKVLLLDLCHSGSGADLKKQPSTATMVRKLRTQRLSTTIIASCIEEQRGLVHPQTRTGLFAAAIAEAYGGAADVDRTLRISSDNLFETVKTFMANASGYGGRQTPEIFPPRKG